jgi:hypothetical protein
VAVPNFIAKSTTPSEQCLRTGAGIVVEQYASLRDRIIALKGRPAAALFAEPVLSRKGRDLEIAWYSDYPGAPTPIGMLDRDARSLVGEKLKERLSTLAPILGDAAIGQLLARAFYIQAAAIVLQSGDDFAAADGDVPFSERIVRSRFTRSPRHRSRGRDPQISGSGQSGGRHSRFQRRYGRRLSKPQAVGNARQSDRWPSDRQRRDAKIGNRFWKSGACCVQHNSRGAGKESSSRDLDPLSVFFFAPNGPRSSEMGGAFGRGN